jgi:hypothetical protein
MLQEVVCVLIVCDEGQFEEWRGGRRWDPKVDESEEGIKYTFFNWLGRQSKCAVRMM